MTTTDHATSPTVTTLADATRRLQRTLDRNIRDRPHQHENGTLVIGARARDIELILSAIESLSTRRPANLDLDEAATQPDPSR